MLTIDTKRPDEGMTLHKWVGPRGPIKWDHCGVCGIIKRKDGKNSLQCKGPARVTLRRG